MTEQDIRKNFANNITKLRKSKNFSQAELASKLSYSDKAISKWETGETMPDVISMYDIAHFFNLTINDLISNNNVVKKSNKLKNRILITLSSIGLSFFVATIVFFFLNIFNVNNSYLAFISALPIAAIIFIVFSKLWFKKVFTFISISILIWSIALLLMLAMNFYLFWIILILATICNVLFGIYFKIEK